jgi:hypothetical protein
MIEAANDQTVVMQHIMAIPVFLIFAILNLVEVLFGASLAPLAMLLGGAGTAYMYQQRNHAALDVKKTV